MFTQGNQTDYSREECLDAAAESLAAVYARLETATAPAEARAV